MINLPITLISVVTTDDYVPKTLDSMLHTLKSIKPNKSILISPSKHNLPNDIESIALTINKDYSLWLIEELVNYIYDSSHLLVHQWDSAVIDPSKWTDEFLQYDYIGAPWPVESNFRVGNGGFSLRSKKFLEDSCTLGSLLPIGKFVVGNEDYFLCNTLGKFLTNVKKIKFPPIELARQFSVERPIIESPHSYNDLSTYQSFGFHGDFNTAGMDLINGGNI